MMIDLRSDTITKPTPEMREAMANAEVGDDQYGEDPTVAALEQRAAEIMGKEAAMYVPSGTMGNAVALLTHARPGEIVLLDSECHIYVYEQAGLAALGGLMPVMWESPNGCPSPDFVQAYVTRTGRQYPRAGLVCVENTHNRRGGAVISPEELSAVHRVTREAGVPLHMDGARIFNAAAALGVAPRDLAVHADSVQFCLSKGLCAPVGSILAGSEAFISEALRNRRRLGGAMRQSGVIAAAGLIALNEMPKRLKEDHENARRLAEQIGRLPELGVDPNDFPTNIVIVRTEPLGISAEEVSARLRERGVLTTIYGPTMLRFVTNHDATRAQVEQAAVIARGLFEELVASRRARSA